MTKIDIVPRSQRGFALLIVLWTMVLLSLLFSRIVGQGRSEMEIASNLRNAAALGAEVDGIVYRAIFDLLSPAAAVMPTASITYRLKLPDGLATVEITDLGGRVNPNIASPALMSALLQQVGAQQMDAASVAEAILDWRSPDTQGRFEAPAYQQAGLTYAPAGAPFASIDELGLVLGMTPDLLEKLAPHLSLYNRDNPSFDLADPVVRHALTALGSSEGNQQRRPPRDVTIVAAILRKDGTRSERRSDVELHISSVPEGFRILTWED
ncbi:MULTISPECIES: general secretion pathway protein GspK [unclassified Acidisoma]|uniref:general secretion pathway protein GspK n=1 Tax=unclassified Acidisoma TaxID=2634065 RepID=UPI00131C2750|nr:MULTISPECIES: type II secretion system protein GspK [unclassified Acidisoma]